jgi:hypothetical protein
MPGTGAPRNVDPFDRCGLNSGTSTAIGEELGTMFNRLYNELAHIHLKWSEFLERGAAPLARTLRLASDRLLDVTVMMRRNAVRRRRPRTDQELPSVSTLDIDNDDFDLALEQCATCFDRIVQKS